MKNIFITNIPMMGDRLKKGIYESGEYGIANKYVRKFT